MEDGIRVFRLEGGQTFAQAVDELVECLRQARDAGVRRVLVDVRGLTGFPSPDLAARLGMVRRLADMAAGRIKVAMVARPEFIDGERFGVVAARGMGLDGSVFDDDRAARRWLEQDPVLWAGPPPVF